MSGKPTAGAAYFREYRRRHRERILKQEEARRRARGVRPTTNAPAGSGSRRHSEADLAALDHPLLERARRIVGAPPRSGTIFAWPDEWDYEDAVQEAVMAMLSHRDPEKAARDAMTKARTWRNLHVQIIEGAALGEDS